MNSNQNILARTGVHVGRKVNANVQPVRAGLFRDRDMNTTVKECFKCHRTLPIAEFYEHPRMGDGHLGKCKECTKRDVKERSKLTRQERHEYEQMRFKKPERKKQILEGQRRRRRLHPEKNRAYLKVKRAIKTGRLVKMPCEVCGDINVQAHHDDHFKPLEVRWLCFKHHRELHGQVVI